MNFPLTKICLVNISLGPGKSCESSIDFLITIRIINLANYLLKGIQSWAQINCKLKEIQILALGPVI